MVDKIIQTCIKKFTFVDIWIAIYMFSFIKYTQIFCNETVEIRPLNFGGIIEFDALETHSLRYFVVTGAS